MKELSSHIKEEVKVAVEVQQEKQTKFLGSIKKYPGHTIWQIDLRTQIITKAEFSEEFATLEGVIKRKLITQEGHWYCSALNMQSAFNKFNKMAKYFVSKLQVA